MITEAHKRNRVEWAKHHINDNWKNTLFTDETGTGTQLNTGTKVNVQIAVCQKTVEKSLPGVIFDKGMEFYSTICLK